MERQVESKGFSVLLDGFFREARQDTVVRPPVGCEIWTYLAHQGFRLSACSLHASFGSEWMNETTRGHLV